jgi:hypothetical protein
VKVAVLSAASGEVVFPCFHSMRSRSLILQRNRREWSECEVGVCEDRIDNWLLAM